MSKKDYKIMFKTLKGENYIYYLYDDGSIEFQGKDPKMKEEEWTRKFGLIKSVTEFMKIYPKAEITFKKE